MTKNTDKNFLDKYDVVVALMNLLAIEHKCKDSVSLGLVHDVRMELMQKFGCDCKQEQRIVMMQQYAERGDTELKRGKIDAAHQEFCKLFKEFNQI